MQSLILLALLLLFSVWIPTVNGYSPFSFSTVQISDKLMDSPNEQGSTPVDC